MQRLTTEMISSSWRSALRHIKNSIVCAFTYALVLAGGITLLLLASSAIGYLPYSDRPGPGWFSPHLPRLEELRFFAGWAVFFIGPFALLWGVVLYIFTSTIAQLGSPKLLARIFGGVFAGALGFLGVAAAGWYIAISSVGVYGAAILGLTFGSVLLPRFVNFPALPQRRWWHWAAIATTCALFATGILYPALPDRDAQVLEINVVRLVPGPEKLEPPGGSSAIQTAIIDSLGLHGRLHGGIQSSSSGPEDKQARALIVVRGTISTKATLHVPKATDVVYIQDGTIWRMYPANAPTLDQTITLTQDNAETLSMTIGDGRSSRFSWYPPIRDDLP
jgi:MFS family permease